MCVQCANRMQLEAWMAWRVHFRGIIISRGECGRSMGPRIASRCLLVRGILARKNSRALMTPLLFSLPSFLTRREFFLLIYGAAVKYFLIYCLPVWPPSCKLLKILSSSSLHFFHFFNVES